MTKRVQWSELPLGRSSTVPQARHEPAEQHQFVNDALDLIEHQVRVVPEHGGEVALATLLCRLAPEIFCTCAGERCAERGKAAP